MKCDTEKFKVFFHKMLDQGDFILRLLPFEAGFMSLAHTTEDIEKHFAAADLHLQRLVKTQSAVKFNRTFL